MGRSESFFFPYQERMIGCILQAEKNENRLFINILCTHIRVMYQKRIKEKSVE